MNLISLRFSACCWIAASLCAGQLRAVDSPSLDAVEKSAGDWLKVRSETSRLETEWSTQRQLLESMAHGLTERAQSLETKRDYLRARTAKDRDELVGLDATNKSSGAAFQSLEEQLKATDVRLLRTRRSLPPRLSAALELPYKSLAAPGLAVGERMQLTITVLNRCLQFNHSIICEDEVLNVGGDGTARQLEVIYWGLSHGYALDRPAGKVWYGSPGPDGWQWEPATTPVEPVAKLIAIYRGKADPEFVEVSVTSKNQLLAAAKK